MIVSKSAWVIQKEKDSPQFANIELDNYESLKFAHFFDTKEEAKANLDPNNEEELVRKVKLTFELID